MPKTRTLLLAFLVLVPPLPAQAQERSLTMTGSARIEARPDVTRARGGIHVEDDSAADALERAERRMAALADTMKAFGAVEAAPVALGQDRSRNTRLIGSDDAGFSARGTVTVTLADPSKAGAALDAFVRAGIEGVASLSHDIADRAPLLRQARERAVADAMERARTYADAANLTLGPIVALSETTTESGPVDGPGIYAPHASYGARGAAGPQSLTIAATVTIRWALE